MKTRIAADLGDGVALDVYRAMLMDVVDLALGWRSRGVGRRVEVWTDRSDWVPGGIQHHPQLGGDLGQRMERAMREGLKRADRVGIVGSDAPSLGVHHLERAFEALQERECRMGPCPDGGYHLMTLGSLPPGALWDLPWSRSDTLERVRSRLEGWGIEVSLLQSLGDLDTLGDLRQLNYRPELWRDALKEGGGEA